MGGVDSHVTSGWSTAGWLAVDQVPLHPLAVNLGYVV